jgi:hypothetical protein
MKTKAKTNPIDATAKPTNPAPVPPVRRPLSIRVSVAVLPNGKVKITQLYKEQPNENEDEDHSAGHPRKCAVNGTNSARTGAHPTTDCG